MKKINLFSSNKHNSFHQLDQPKPHKLTPSLRPSKNLERSKNSKLTLLYLNLRKSWTNSIYSVRGRVVRKSIPKRIRTLRRRKICLTILLIFDGPWNDHNKTSIPSIYIFGSLWSFLGITRRDSLLAVWFNHVKRTYQFLIDIENGSPVLEHAAIIRGRKYCNQLLFPKKLITFLNNLNTLRRTWWDRQMRSKSLLLRNCVSTSTPNI